jgi:magnesium transporter
VPVRWTDLVDPTREEVLAALPLQVDPEVVEALAAPPSEVREPRPLLEAHGSYVFGVLTAARPLPDLDRIAYQEVDVVATSSLVVTVRKSPPGGVPPFDPAGLRPVEESASAGDLVHRLVDEIADTYLSALDDIYGEIEELEDSLDSWPPRRVRARISSLRHELLVHRKMASATRALIRRVLDGRIEIGADALFPPEIELRFADSSETFIRVTEELDIARDLLSGARDHHQSIVAESQADIVKKLTVVASLVLVPSLIVGFYGQNFETEFDDGFWGLWFSLSLIAASTIVQVALYRWRRWI